jgi:hypothetical protein
VPRQNEEASKRRKRPKTERSSSSRRRRRHEAQGAAAGPRRPHRASKADAIAIPQAIEITWSRDELLAAFRAKRPIRARPPRGRLDSRQT